jgi:myo-inositol-1(or 4)-monophosphatase
MNNDIVLREYLEVAIEAALEAGEVLTAGLQRPLEVLETTQHDIKLAIDVACETRIRARIQAAFPEHALLGEEGGGDIAADRPTWIIDPLDGTSNYSRGLPHFCTSIAVQQGDSPLVGVVYDPLADELFHALHGGGAFLNGQPIHVSEVEAFERAMVAMGFAKTVESMRQGFAHMEELSRRIHKVRILGAAALDLAYVAMGRLDAFIEYGLSTWDIAAGAVLVREAGGGMELQPLGEHRWHVHAHNGRLW